MSQYSCEFRFVSFAKFFIEVLNESSLVECYVHYNLKLIEEIERWKNATYLLSTIRSICKGRILYRSFSNAHMLHENMGSHGPVGYVFSFI